MTGLLIIEQALAVSLQNEGFSIVVEAPCGYE